jgi:poly-gamma-glutamate synthesis protein (capsule biosynthesis protein)
MPQPAEQFTITWAGDLLLGDAARKRLDRHGYTWPFVHLRQYLVADYLIGNQEGPLTDRTEPHFPNARWSYAADPAGAGALAEVGFGAMGLNNNHAFDRGPAGLAETLAHLHAAGVTPFGAGRTGQEASAPLLVPTPFGRVAVLGLGDRFRHGYTAGPAAPGTTPITAETIAVGRAAALAAGARWVIAFVHWGANYQPVTDEQRRQAAEFAAAGYDLVIGHGPHIPQPVELVAGVPVLYSIGNSVFGSRGRFARYRVSGHGLLATTVFTATGLERVAFTCFANDNRIVGYQPYPAAPDTTDAYGLTWTGHHATFPVPQPTPASSPPLETTHAR